MAIMSDASCSYKRCQEPARFYCNWHRARKRCGRYFCKTHLAEHDSRTRTEAAAGGLNAYDDSLVAPITRWGMRS